MLDSIINLIELIQKILPANSLLFMDILFCILYHTFFCYYFTFYEYHLLDCTLKKKTNLRLFFEYYFYNLLLLEVYYLDRIPKHSKFFFFFI